MDMRTPSQIQSALVVDTGISTAKVQKAVRDHKLKTKILQSIDSSIPVENFDVVIGFLPENPNVKSPRALPFAEYLDSRLSKSSKKSTGAQPLFVTSSMGLETVTDKLDSNEAIGDKTRSRINRWAAFHSHWLVSQATHSAEEWEGALNTLKQKGKNEFLFPSRIRLDAALKSQLRYGENPHQHAALFVYPSAKSIIGVANATQIQGKELSYNNLNDTDAALELVAEFDPKISAACAIIKHANPCGVAIGDSLADAYRKALSCDPVSAFGGVIAFNRPLDAEAAEEVARIFTEVVIAPDATNDARDILSRKKNLRLLVTGGLPNPGSNRLLIRSIAGGLLVQTRDNVIARKEDLKVVTKRKPTEQEMTDMLFAFTVAKHVKSNTIVYAKDGQTAGIGAGQMSRVDSARIAAIKAREAAETAGWAQRLTVGSAAASDAFFPFADGLLTVAEAGATAVIQPGGSIRDDEVIKAADEKGLAMVFTGIRHFRH